jgi:hypothetical protein
MASPFEVEFEPLGRPDAETTAGCQSPPGGSNEHPPA